MKKSNCLFLVLAILISQPIFGKAPKGINTNNKITNMLAKITSNDEVFRTLINANNWLYWVNNDGVMGYDTESQQSGGIYPKGKSPVVYTDGLVFGGYVDEDDNGEFDKDLDRLAVGGTTYGTGLQCGWIENGNPADINKVWRIRDDFQSLNPEDVSYEAEILGLSENEVLDQYEYDWKNWPAEHGAPYYDNNNNGIYDPDPNGNNIYGEEGEDRPGVANADQVIWFAANDLNEGLVTSLYGSQPIGLEVQVTIWAYAQPETKLGQLIFKNYKIINKSDKDILNTYLSQFVDPDIGDYNNDFIGCDTSLSMGYAYNGDPTDSYFTEISPPAVGYYFLQGPIVESPGDSAFFNFTFREGYRNLPMTSFGWFAAGSNIADPTLGGDYEGTKQWYNLLKGFKPYEDLENPVPWTIGNQTGSETTKFPLCGDPINNPSSNRIDGNAEYLPPGDRRMCLSSGPFYFAKGDTQEVTVAIGGSATNSNVAKQYILNIDGLREIANYGMDIILKKSPPPSAKLETLNKSYPNSESVEIEVAIKLENASDVNGCKFKLQSFNGENEEYIIKLFDDGSHNDQNANDNIWGNSFLIQNKKYPFIAKALILTNNDEFTNTFLSNISLRKPPQISNYKIIWENKAQDKFINNGERVYLTFNITNADSINNISKIRTADNEFKVDIQPGATYQDSSIYIIFQAPQTGTSIDTSYTLSFDGWQKNFDLKMPLVEWTPSEAHGDTLEVENISRPGIANVLPIVIQESLLNNHKYKITFNYNQDSILVWNLKDLTQDSIILNNQKVRESLEYDFPIKGGIEWKVYNPAPGLEKIVEQNPEGDLVDDGVSILEYSLGSTGYIVTGLSGYTFDRFGLLGYHDYIIDFSKKSVAWQYFDDIEGGEPCLKEKVPFALYKKHYPSGELERMFVAIFDHNTSMDSSESVGAGVWDTTGTKYFGVPTYEPIFGYLSKDGPYNPDKESEYMDVNELSEPPSNTGWGDDGNTYDYPVINYLYFEDYLGNGLPIGNKIVFYTNKLMNTEDTLIVEANSIVAVSENDNKVKEFNLSHNYPNPFNPVTSIRYSLPKTSKVTLTVFDLLGRKVETLVNREKKAGRYTIKWNASKLSSGIYFYRIKAGKFTDVKKCILMK